GGIDDEDMLALVKINLQGRLHFVNGDDQEPIPGIRCYTGGRHTFASQYVSVKMAAGTAVFTSDNVYLYENLEKHVPLAPTLHSPPVRRTIVRPMTSTGSSLLSPRPTGPVTIPPASNGSRRWRMGSCTFGEVAP